jgi:hypothetical protein
VSHYPDLVTALRYAYQWWTFMDDLQMGISTRPLPVNELITALATDTYNLTAISSSPLLRDGVSFDYAMSKDDSKVLAAYGGQQAQLRDRMLRTIGASIAFMVKSADFAPSPATLPASPCACPAGRARSGQDFAGNPIIEPSGQCIACGTGAFQGLPNLLDGRCVAICPADKPTSQAGVCVATGACNPDTPFLKNGVCVAACCVKSSSCAAATPFLENGACVAACAAPFLANYRECRTACPTGQVPDPDHLAANLCIIPAAPTPPVTCTGPAGDSAGSCCRARSGLCTGNGDCCSKSCQFPDGICRGVIGDPCTSGNGCVTGVCTAGLCARGTGNSPCINNSDCGSLSCPPGGTCSGASQSCSQDLDCASRDCIRKCAVSTTSGPCVIGTDCRSGQCVGGVCKGGPGETCQNTSQCINHDSCVQGTCCTNDGGGCICGSECCSGTCQTDEGTSGVCGTVVIIPG